MPADNEHSRVLNLGSWDGSKGQSIQNVDDYGIIEGIARVQILLNREEMEYIYIVKEPEATLLEKRIIDGIIEEIEKMVPLLIDGSRVKSFFDLDEVIWEYLSSRHRELSEELRKKLSYTVQKRYLGLGKLYVLVQDPNVEDISCNGPGMPVFIYHKKYGSLKTNVFYTKESELSSYIIKLAQLCGKEVSISSPILDGITSSGHRVQGIYGTEISPRGSAFTIRLFREKPFTPVDLVRSGAASAELVAYLWYMVEYLNSALIVGPPAVGKTSTLNAILMMAPPNTKIFSIEETREINILHPNWVAASTRETSSTSASTNVSWTKIDLFELVKMAMRQRPTYLAVGEVRGKEAYTLFQAMSTGHTTYSTMHAESMSTLMNRLESEPLNVPRILVSYLKTVIIGHFIRRGSETIRRLTEVNEILGVDNTTGEVVFNKVFTYDSKSDRHIFSGYSLLFRSIASKRGIDEDELLKEFRDRAILIEELSRSGDQAYGKVFETFNSYYTDRIRGKSLAKGGSNGK